MKTILFSEHFVPGEFPVMVERMPYSGLSAGEAHSHEFSELTLITKGKCLHRCDGKSAGVGPEDVLLVHPGSVHCFEHAEKVEAISLLYDAEVPYAPLASSGFPMMREFYPESGTPKRNEAQPIGKFPECDFAMMMGMLLRLRYEVRHKRLGHKLLVPALFTEIVTYFARGYSTHIEVNAHWRLRKAIVYMNSHYREKISIARLCRIAGMSERSLFRQFHESIMMGPYEYLIRIRTLHAMELLRDKRLSIAEIALRCGFCDSNHLCKVFKQEFGRTPKYFRNTDGE